MRTRARHRRAQTSAHDARQGARSTVTAGCWRARRTFRARSPLVDIFFLNFFKILSKFIKFFYLFLPREKRLAAATLSREPHLSAAHCDERMQAPVLVLNTNTKRDTGRRAQLANVQAAKVSARAGTAGAHRRQMQLHAPPRTRFTPALTPDRPWLTLCARLWAPSRC